MVILLECQYILYGNCWMEWCTSPSSVDSQKGTSMDQKCSKNGDKDGFPELHRDSPRKTHIRSGSNERTVHRRPAWLVRIQWLWTLRFWLFWLFSWLLSADSCVKERCDGDNREQNDGANKTCGISNVRSNRYSRLKSPRRTTDDSSVHPAVQTISRAVRGDGGVSRALGVGGGEGGRPRRCTA